MNKIIKFISGMFIRKPSLNIKTGWLYSFKNHSDMFSNSRFDPRYYSRFKYGDTLVAKTYGYELAELFINDNKEIFSLPEKDLGLVITTCPYKNIQKGSSSIIKFFKEYLNTYLFSIGKSAATDIVVIKDSMFEGDYGTFSKEKRASTLKQSGTFAPDGYLAGKRLIAIDDVRITGSLEKSYTDFFSNKGLKNIYFLYVAVVDIKYAQETPTIEFDLNHSWINSKDGFDKLVSILNSQYFAINARVCKFVLSSKDIIGVTDFFSKLCDDVIVTLYVASIGDGYASMQLYQNVFQILKNEMKKRKLIVGSQLAIPKLSASL